MKTFKSFEEYKKYCEKYMENFQCKGCQIKKGNMCDYYFEEAQKLGGTQEEVDRRMFETIQAHNRKAKLRKLLNE